MPRGSVCPASIDPGRGEGEVPLTLKAARDRFEQAYVLRALEREDWNQSRAACTAIR
jgi:hypothetical protein